MNQSGIKLSCNYYNGEQPVAHPAELDFGDNEIVLTSNIATQTYNYSKLKLSPRIGKADRFIALPDGGQCQCSDHPLLDRLPLEIKSEGPVAWLEMHISVAIVSIGIIIASLVFGYIFGLPILVEIIVKRIPISTELVLGENVLEWFDENEWFKASEVDQERQDLIRQNFARFYKDLVIAPYIKLEFRNSEIIGPNAFALPGGIIIITDQMIEFAQSQEEILAILTHELGHVEQRHNMRLVLQSSFVALVATAVTADAASLSAAVVGVPTILIQKKYSRNFENMADQYAFDLLKRHGVSPEAYADIMERIGQNQKTRKPLSFMATHPITEERIKRAREAANLLDTKNSNYSGIQN